MSVYSFLHYVTGKVQLNEALTSTRRHWSTIWKKRLLACLYIHFYIVTRKVSLKKQGRQSSCCNEASVEHQQGDIGRQFERKDFWHVCIFIFTLCHGQSSVERGFNINKETLVDNLKEKTSGMSVYSFLHYVTGKVQLNEALTSTRRHWSTIWKKSMSVYSLLHYVTGKVHWTRL